MKVYISYVEQGEKNHRHYAETIDINVNYCSSEMTEITKWLEGKQSELPEDRRIILINKFEV